MPEIKIVIIATVILTGVMIAIMGFVATTFAAPLSNIFRTLQPETDDTYYIGTTSPSNARYKAIFIGTGTSTAANGFDLSAGCYAQNGTCVAGGGLASVNSGTANQIAYYAGATTLQGASSILTDGSATSSIVGTLKITGAVAASSTLQVTGTSTFYGDGQIQIGDISGVFPLYELTTENGILFGTSTPYAGFWTEVSNRLLRFGANVPQLNVATDTALAGGTFGFDLRGNLFAISYYPSTDQGYAYCPFGCDSLQIDLNTGSTTLVATGEGRVGVGTTSPAEKFSVQGNAFFSGNLTNVANITATGTVTTEQLSVNGGATTTSFAAIPGGSFVVNNASSTIVNLKAASSTVQEGIMLDSNLINANQFNWWIHPDFTTLFTNTVIDQRVGKSTSTISAVNTDAWNIASGSPYLPYINFDTLNNSVNLFRFGNSQSRVSMTGQGTTSGVLLRTFTSVGSTTFTLQDNGHPNWSGAQGTLSACGASPAFSSGSNDKVGKVTIGTGVTTSCVYTFAFVWNRQPTCFVNNESSPADVASTVTTITTMTIQTSTGADFSGDVISYSCDSPL